MHLAHLAPEEQEQLRQQVLAGDTAARDRFADLLLRYLRKFAWLNDDVVQDYAVRLLNELDQQDPTKGPLSSWCYAQVSAASNFAEMNAWKASQRTVSFDAPPGDEYGAADLGYEDHTIDPAGSPPHHP